jgi:hypothetical protein
MGVELMGFDFNTWADSWGSSWLNSWGKSLIEKIEKEETIAVPTAYYVSKKKEFFEEELLLMLARLK